MVINVDRNVYVNPLKLSFEPLKSFLLVSPFFTMFFIELRATSHTRLRAHDQYTSSTLIGGKGGAGPSSLHTTLEGPTEYVNARWM